MPRTCEVPANFDKMFTDGQFTFGNKTATTNAKQRMLGLEAMRWRHFPSSRLIAQLALKNGKKVRDFQLRLS